LALPLAGAQIAHNLVCNLIDGYIDSRSSEPNAKWWACVLDRCRGHTCNGFGRSASSLRRAILNSSQVLTTNDGAGWPNMSGQGGAESSSATIL
jgi:hypothetical protein